MSNEWGLNFWRRFILFIYKCFLLFAALIIQTAQQQQHHLIDIQESPLITTDQAFNYDDESIPKIILRRHSFQDNHENNFVEQQFVQHIQNNCDELNGDNRDWDEKLHQHNNSDKQCHANALNWLKNFNIIRNKCQYDTIPQQQRRFKMVLRKTSSENELLLMTPSSSSSSSGPSVDDIPAIRRSFSSGLLF